MAVEQFTFFSHSNSPFSQWYLEAPFFKDGVRFKTAENFMMWRKGQLFGASQTLLDQIVRATPLGAKKFGRLVPKFNQSIWDVAAKPLVAEGNLLKFSQNPAALESLLATEDTTLVEAAPWDTIWGIGLAADDPRAWRRDTWLGSNWLGEVLTDLRRTVVMIRR